MSSPCSPQSRSQSLNRHRSQSQSLNRYPSRSQSQSQSVNRFHTPSQRLNRYRSQSQSLNRHASPSQVASNIYDCVASGVRYVLEVLYVVRGIHAVPGLTGFDLAKRLQSHLWTLQDGSHCLSTHSFQFHILFMLVSLSTTTTGILMSSSCITPY